jgi:EmrB/QacA subfamily drug resistance transporter
MVEQMLAPAIFKLKGNQQNMAHVDSQQSTATADDRRDARSAPNDSAPVQGQINKWIVFTIVAIGVFMATLDSSIVNVSLPAIAHGFGIPLNGAIEWVVIAYLVTTAAVILTAGRLADMIGHRIIWASGLVLFTLGSVFCGAAPSVGLLIAARALQGLGGALLFAVSPAMLTRAFPASERGRALGFNALVVALGTSTGPTLGGLITESLSWRWIFYVNVPLGVIGFIATMVLLHTPVQHRGGHFDPLGALLLAIGLASLTGGLSFGQELGWTSLPIIVLGAAAVIALGALPFVEQRMRYPILNFALFRNRVFVSAQISLMISFLALFAVSFLLPFYFEQLRGFPVFKAGLLLTPLPLTIAIIAPWSGSLADRIGTRWLAAGGLALASIGLVLLSRLNAQSSILDIIWRLAVTGAGQALFQSPNNSALLGAAPREQQGVASGFLATGRVIGQSVSVAIAGAVFTGLGAAAAGQVLAANAAGQGGGDLAQLQHTFMLGFRTAFLVCAGIAVLGVFTSLVRGKEERAVTAA